MQLNLSNVKAWARENSFSGYCGPRVIKSVLLHDLARTCVRCEGVFTEDHDGERDEELGWFCEDCTQYIPGGYSSPSSQHGTHNHVRGL